MFYGTLCIYRGFHKGCDFNVALNLILDNNNKVELRENSGVEINVKNDKKKFVKSYFKPHSLWATLVCIHIYVQYFCEL